MGEQRALIIALEKYASIKGVTYARNDAMDFADALRDLGVDVPASSVLLDQQATKTTIESRLRTELSGLHQGDRFFLYYAGHGIALNGENCLTCYDTQLGDLANTLIRLQDIYRSLRQAASSQVLVFLDSCHSGLEVGADARQIIDHLAPNELQDFFETAEACLCFSSCKVDEVAVADPSVQHGIWTHHLLEALRGNVAEVLSSGGLLTASALQDYLSMEVPRTIRRVRSRPHAQTPWLFGGATREVLVADLSPLLARRRVTVNDVLPTSTDITLSGESRQQVRELAGFRKNHHHVPSETSDWTRDFVIRCARPDLETLREEYFRSIRTQFGYKRKDLTVTEGDGEVSIIAPSFRLSIACTQSDDNPAYAVFRYEVTEIEDPITLDQPAFTTVFDDILTRLELSTNQTLDIAAFIDALEDLTPDGIEFEYPHNCSYCEISFKDTRHTIRLEPFSIVFEPGRTGGPKGILEGFKETFESLASHPTLAAAFFPAQARQQALPPGREVS